MVEVAGTKEENKKKEDAGWDEAIRTFIYAVLLALVFRSLFFEPFHIPSSSMKDTLLVGDYIFVSKYSYGYSRYSFPLGFPLFDGRVFESQPERGDVVVFRLPSSPRIDYIKRLIGLPGDVIQVKDGVLYVNARPVKRERKEDYAYRMDDGMVVKVRRYEETMENGKQYSTLDMTQFGEVDNTLEYRVPEGHYFMMGDNRDNSTDSRYLDHVGFVPAENLIGKARVIFFSMDERVHFWEVWKWFNGLRYDRFFKTIE